MIIGFYLTLGSFFYISFAQNEYNREGNEMNNTSEALIVIDVQNDFCPGGSLAVPEGDEVVPLINKMMADYSTIVLTQDWHPTGHSSFASSHEGKDPFSLIQNALWRSGALA